MSAVRRVTKNAVLLNAARIISTLGKFFLFIYVARILGQEILGQFSFAIIFTSFFSIVISLGMDDLLVREVARDNALSKKYLGNMFTLRFILALIVFCALVVTINLLDNPAETRLAVYIFGGYIVFTSFSFLLRANFRAFEKMEWDALPEIIEALLTTIAGVVLVFAGYGLIALCLTFLISSIINVIISLAVNYKSFTRFKLEFDFQLWKNILVKATPFGVFALFILYPQVDTILLSSLKGSVVVGKYSAAYYVITAFSPVVMNFMIALMPLISRYFLSSKTMLGFVYEKSVKYLLILAFPVSVGAMVLSEKLISFLYGSGYQDSVLVLQILAWNCVLLAVSRPMFSVLGAINRQGTCAVITVSALALSICLNLILIPHLSYIGSGIITLINGVLVILASWWAASKYGFPLQLIKITWKPLLSSVFMGAILYGIDTMTNTGLIFLVLLGVIIYFASLIALKGFAKDDWYLVKEALHKGSRSESVPSLQRGANKELMEIKN